MWQDKGEHRRAIDDFTRAIEVGIKRTSYESVNYVDCYIERAHSKAKIRDFDGALEDLAKAMGRQPRNARLFYIRGSVRISMRDLDQAIVDLTTAIDIDPTYAKSFYSLGHTWDVKGDFKRAIEYYSLSEEVISRV